MSTPSPENDPLIGQTVGEYQVTGLLGQGGMGRVYQAVQPLIGKKVALKLLRRELSDDAAQAERLLAEARTVNAIGHRGIIDIFGFGALPDGRQYVVMEQLSGRALSRVLHEGGALEPGEALELLDEILDALAAAHAAGVTHRDLKPSNVFLVEPPGARRYVKLLDFGIAKRSEVPGAETPQTHDSKVLGTPEYLAPEQARGQSVGPRTDLYALGVMAFQMLTGELPFQADNPYELVNQHLNRPAPRLSSKKSGLPAGLEPLVAQLMEKRPEDRPSSATAVRERLRAIRSGTAGETLPLEAASPSRSMVLPLIVGGLILGLLAGWLVLRTSGGPAPLTPEPPVTKVEPKPTEPVVVAPAPEAAPVQPALPPSAPSPDPEPAAAPDPAPAAADPTGPRVMNHHPPPPRSAGARALALHRRYARVQAAWQNVRASRTPEDRRLFDAMLEQVGHQLDTGARQEAAKGLNDFVKVALGSQEP